MSDFRQAAEEYLAIRRALGFKFALQGRLLMQFVSYLEDIQARALTTDLAVAWAKAPAHADPSWWGQRLTVVRGFASHLHAIDGTCEVPPSDVLPAHFRRAVPYLYSEGEIAGLMGAAGALLPPLRGETYYPHRTASRDYTGQPQQPESPANTGEPGSNSRDYGR